MILSYEELPFIYIFFFQKAREKKKKLKIVIFPSWWCWCWSRSNHLLHSKHESQRTNEKVLRWSSLKVLKSHNSPKSFQIIFITVKTIHRTFHSANIYYPVFITQMRCALCIFFFSFSPVLHTLQMRWRKWKQRGIKKKKNYLTYK